MQLLILTMAVFNSASRRMVTDHPAFREAAIPFSFKADDFRPETKIDQCL
jgi:hypothetical protein